jgi:hypothetical protein
MPTTTTPVTVTTTAKKYSLGWLDVGKGLVVAIVTPVIPIVYTAINAASSPTGTFVMPWKIIALAAASGFMGYITKNFFSPSTTTITGAPEGSAVNIAATPVAGASVSTTATK